MRKEHYFCHLCTTDNVYYRFVFLRDMKNRRNCFFSVILIYFVIISVRVIIYVKLINVKMFNLQMYFRLKLIFVHIKHRNIVKIELKQDNWVRFQWNFNQQVYVIENNRVNQLAGVNTFNYISKNSTYLFIFDFSRNIHKWRI